MLTAEKLRLSSLVVFCLRCFPLNRQEIGLVLLQKRLNCKLVNEPYALVNGMLLMNFLFLDQYSNLWLLFVAEGKSTIHRWFRTCGRRNII